MDRSFSEVVVQDGAPLATIFVDLSLVVPFTTMVFHRVCWGDFPTL